MWIEHGTPLQRNHFDDARHIEPENVLQLGVYTSRDAYSVCILMTGTRSRQEFIRHLYDPPERTLMRFTDASLEESVTLRSFTLF